MQRRRHLVAYDIRDPKRLRSVAIVMLGHGVRMQYSVFVCDLTARERLNLVNALLDIIDRSVDSIAVVDLGAVDHRAFTFFGPKPSLPTVGPVVI